MRLHNCTIVALTTCFTLATAASYSQDANTPWKHHAIDRGLSGGDGVRLHDADGDGDPDVVVGWEESGASRLYLNPGARESAKRAWPQIDVGGAPQVEDAVMADVDGDGRVDVISACEGNSKSLIVHFAPASGDYMDAAAWTSVKFPEEVAGDRRWMFSVALDVNEDGRLDIVSGGKDSNAKIAWFEAPATNKRDLSTWKFHAISDIGWVMSLVTEDMDGDGDIDIVGSDRHTDVGIQGAWWLENPGVGGGQTKPWAHHFISEPNIEAMFLRLHDLDGDGDRDVVVPLRLNKLKVLYKNANTADPDKNPSRLRWYERLDATGLHWRSHEIAYPANVGKSKGVAVGDIDGDGRVDIVVSHGSASAPLSGMVWLSYENTVFDAVWQRHEISGPNGSKYDRVELADFDGDGDLDAMTTEENYGKDSLGLGAIWYENPGATPAEFKSTLRLDDLLKDKTMTLAYETSFDTPLKVVSESTLTRDGMYIREADAGIDWILEGPGSVKVEDGALHMDCAAGHTVLWNTRRFPADFVAEWAFTHHHQQGLAILFFAATSSSGGSIHQPGLPAREGVFTKYTKGKIDCYHTSYFAISQEGVPRGETHIRKNPGSNLVAEGPCPLDGKNRGPHRIRVAKLGKRTVLEIDGKVSIDWSDPEVDGVAALGGGQIGLRQMQHALEASYEYFKVYAVD